MEVHKDKSAVTLNVCLLKKDGVSSSSSSSSSSSAEEDGALYFHRLHPSRPAGADDMSGPLSWKELGYGEEEQENFARPHPMKKCPLCTATYVHTVGTAIVHLGCLVHGAWRTSGERSNIVMWGREKKRSCAC